MNNEILKLAKDHFKHSAQVEWNEIESFYKATFNAGLEAAAKKAFEFWCSQHDQSEESAAAAIRALEKK